MPCHDDRLRISQKCGYKEEELGIRAVMLFTFSDYKQIACGLQKPSLTEEGQFEIARYNNQELHAVISSSIAEKDCLILGSIAPPDEQMVAVMLLAHTLKQGGAREITGILPYLAYTRQDKLKAGESLAAAWVGSLLKASGFHRILTVDVHSDRDQKLFPIPLVSVSPAKLFAAAIRKHGLTDATIVAADHGAIARCEAVSNAAGMSFGTMPYFEKRRANNGVIHGSLIGEVGPRVIFVDDMLDTGDTLVSACERLRSAGVEEIYIFVTHGLFTGSRWHRLWSFGVRQIFCTDSVQPVAFGLEEQSITVLQVAPLLREHLMS
jgi:ribose-phosphate pyrophosphokinase